MTTDRSFTPQQRPLNCDPDAQRWAREFMEVWNKNPVMDEGWMLSWFANAIMCGVDTTRWKMEAEARSIQSESVQTFAPSEFHTETMVLVRQLLQHMDARPTDDGLDTARRRCRVFLERFSTPPSAEQRTITDAERVRIADANLQALLAYTGGFYSVAMEHGMKRGETANAIAHVESAARALHKLAVSTPSSAIGQRVGEGVACFNLVNQVYFRAGLIACREYMARFVEAQDPAIAQSIRANWWPSLGQDFGPPRKLNWDELAEGEHGTPSFRVKTEITATQEALPVALTFLENLHKYVSDAPADRSADHEA